VGLLLSGFFVAQVAGEKRYKRVDIIAITKIKSNIIELVVKVVIIEREGLSIPLPVAGLKV
jgi:hypothetical protein